MDKNTYLETLSNSLSGLSKNEREEIIYDFNEYFENAQLEGVSEEKVIEELGDPSELAKEFDQKNNEKEIVKEMEIIEKENKEKFRKNFAFDAGTISTFDILSGSEDFIIVPSDDQDIKLDYLLKKNKTRLKPEFIVNQENDHLSFEIKYPRISKFLLGGVRFNAKIRLHIPENWNGKLKIQNIAGDIKKCDVKLSSLTFNTISGDLKGDSISIDELFLRSISGDLKTHELKSKRFEIKTTSGDIKCEKIDVEDLTFRTVSGDIKTNANINHLYFKSVSGDMKTNFLKTPENMRFKTVSGDMILRIPKNSGIELDSKTVSGKLKTEFQFIEKEKNSKKHFKGTVSGENTVNIEFKSVSGDIALKPLKEEA